MIEEQEKDSTLGAGRSENAETAGQLCYEAFKAIANEHNFPADFPSSEDAVGLLTSLLSRGDVYSVVADTERRVVGQQRPSVGCFIDRC